jgi:hypothetical protein
MEGQLLAETDAEGNWLKEYVYLNGEPLAVFVQESIPAPDPVQGPYSHDMRESSSDNPGHGKRFELLKKRHRAFRDPAWRPPFRGPKWKRWHSPAKHWRKTTKMNREGSK